MSECTERRMKWCRWLFSGICLFLVMTGPVGAVEDEMEAMRAEMEELKAMVTSLSQEVRTLQGQAEPNQPDLHEYEVQLQEIREDVDTLSESSTQSAGGIPDGLTIGGYGDVHANFDNGSESDEIDFHRLVMYLGYDFSDWIKFHSETELEHAWTDDGYVLLEQAYVDFLLSDQANIRTGRMLAPVGIINQNHEPTFV